MTQAHRDYAKEEGSTYQYYKDHDNDFSCRKHQIKWHDSAATEYTKISDSDITWRAHNYAGYNSSTDSYGGYYWLTSPYTNSSYYAWNVHDDGNLIHNNVCNNAFAVAPAFCI